MKLSWLCPLAALLCLVVAGLAAAEPTPTRTVCVFCASSDRVDPKYLAAAERIGTELAHRGWTLVYGGSTTGLMGAVARSAKSHGGRVVGVMADSLGRNEVIFKEADEIIRVATLRERKEIMRSRADAILILPGGIGTLDELSESIELKVINQLAKPIVIFNQDGYYDELLGFFERTIQEKFARETARATFTVVRSEDEAFASLAPAVQK